MKSVKCCYCHRPIKGKPQFCVPEGFATNSAHDGKPLCSKCGNSGYPSLEMICDALDSDVVRAYARKR